MQSHCYAKPVIFVNNAQVIKLANFTTWSQGTYLQFLVR